MYSWLLFIGPVEHHHDTHIKVQQKKLNGASTMLNNVFKFKVYTFYIHVTINLKIITYIVHVYHELQVYTIYSI